MNASTRFIGIVGSRRRNTHTDFLKVEDKFFELYQPGDIIVSGGCPKGADAFARKIHKKHFIDYLEFPANWTRYGKPAGYIRNLKIAAWSHFLIACVADDRTGGTEHTIKEAEKLGKQVYLV